MRRYDEAVEVRRGWIGSPGAPGQSGQEGPEQFLWRGRLWKVRAVVAQWVETGPWWLGADAHATRGELVGAEAAGGGPARPMGDLLDERELWRVEASRASASGSSGVFDLSFSWCDASWRLVGCVD